MTISDADLQGNSSVNIKRRWCASRDSTNQNATLVFRDWKRPFSEVYVVKLVVIKICFLDQLIPSPYRLFHYSGVIYSSISSYTSLETEKNTLSKKKNISVVGNP